MVTPARLPIDIREDELRAICEKYDVRELLAFGSVLRDDFGPDSDIDLLVDFEPDTTTGLFGLYDLTRELEALLGREVDLIPRDGLRPDMAAEVLPSARLLYAA
jgi:predicted nucleotidyltransferase